MARKKSDKVEVNELEIGDKLLGLDISTACIGVCLVENDGSKYGKLLELTHVSPSVDRHVQDTEKLFLKKRVFEEFITKYKDLGIKHAIIEAPLLGSNNVNTVSVLLRFNGMISDCIYNVLGVVPKYVSSYDARKYSFPELMTVRKFGKDDLQYPTQKIYHDIKKCKLVLFGSYPWTIDKKAVIQEKVADIFPNVEWIYDSHGELIKQNFDSSDAYVALLGWMNKERYGELEFKSTITKESTAKNGTMKVQYTISYWDVDEVRTTYIDDVKAKEKKSKSETTE
jgi:hypothetical protein